MTVVGGKVAGFANFVPYPDVDHACAVTNGLFVWPIATTLLDDIICISRPVAEISGDGALYLVPKPDGDHRYAYVKKLDA